MIRTYLCDNCDGYGLTGEEMDCLWCDSTGVITADADTADLRSLQPWTGSIGRAANRIRAKHTDPLHDLARTRATNPKSWAYRNARTRAMSMVPRAGLMLCDFRALSQAAKSLRWMPMERAA